jgi:hypothetical protein
MEATAKKRTVTVGEDEAHQVGGSFHQKVEKNVFIEGMTSGVIEMCEDLTLKAPGGFIRIDKTGVTIVGKVTNINSGGAPGTGFTVQASTARSAELADARDGLTGKAGSVKGVQKTPEYATDKGVSRADTPFSSFGGQEFVVDPVPPLAVASMLGDAQTAVTEASAALRRGQLDIAQLNPYDEPSVLEWKKAVAEAKLEQTAAGKIDAVNNYFIRNQTPARQGERIKGLKEVVLSGSSTDLERAVAQHQTLEAAGIPADSMRVIVTDRTAFVAVTDRKQTLAAGADSVPGMPCRHAGSIPPASGQVIGLDSKGIYSYMDKAAKYGDTHVMAP